MRIHRYRVKNTANFKNRILSLHSIIEKQTCTTTEILLFLSGFRITTVINKTSIINIIEKKEQKTKKQNNILRVGTIRNRKNIP